MEHTLAYQPWDGVCGAERKVWCFSPTFFDAGGIEVLSVTNKIIYK